MNLIARLKQANHGVIVLVIVLPRYLDRIIQILLTRS